MDIGVKNISYIYLSNERFPCHAMSFPTKYLFDNGEQYSNNYRSLNCFPKNDEENCVMINLVSNAV